MITAEIRGDNGYNCSCCRETWQRLEDFNSIEELINYLVEEKENCDGKVWLGRLFNAPNEISVADITQKVEERLTTRNTKVAWLETKAFLESSILAAEEWLNKLPQNKIDMENKLSKNREELEKLLKDEPK